MIKPVLDKVEVVRAFPRPETKTAVRMFLRFIPSFASVAAPLTDLTNKSAPNSVVWNEECEGVFKALNSPDFKKGFIVQMDA